MNDLHRAAISGDLDLARKVRASGISLEQKEEQHGNTPLMLAAYNNHPAFVDWLIKEGTEIDARCFNGNTALMKASWSGATACVDLLLRAGAEVNALDKYMMTSAMIAAFYGHVDAVRLLARAGADLHRKDIEGYTALKNAQERGHGKVAAFIINFAGTPPTEASPDQEVAVASSSFELEDVTPFLEWVSTLLEQGFDASAARKLGTEISKLDLDSEKSWVFEVVYNGLKVNLAVGAFMDDLDSPDLTFLGPLSLTETIQQRIEEVQN